MLAEQPIGVEPGDRRQLARRGIDGKLLPGLHLAARVTDVLERVAVVVPPGKPCLIQFFGQGGLVLGGRARTHAVVGLGYVDQCRVGHDQQQLVGRRGPRHVREVVVANRVLLGVAPVMGNVVSRKRDPWRARITLEPGTVTVIGILVWRGFSGPRNPTFSTRERAGISCSAPGPLYRCYQAFYTESGPQPPMAPPVRH